MSQKNEKFFVFHPNFRTVAEGVTPGDAIKKWENMEEETFGDNKDDLFIIKGESVSVRQNITYSIEIKEQL